MLPGPFYLVNLMPDEFNFWTTTVGSFPHLDGRELSRRLVLMLDVPDWPQLTRTSFLENMYVQFSNSLPAIVVDESEERIFFDTSLDLASEMEAFYEPYLAGDLDYYGLRPEIAIGFYSMLEELLNEDAPESDLYSSDPSAWVKGQVTGPISLGLTISDQNRRSGLYDEFLADAIVKNAAMNARWQIRQLKSARPNVILSVDEPYMSSFGSAYVSLSREQVIAMLDEVFAAIHEEGALASVHCCANTDWSVLLGTSVDILNLDAYGYLENLSLYPLELREFLDRGGALMWGIVPNNEEIWEVTPQELARKLQNGFELISRKAANRGVIIDSHEFSNRSLLTTSCGLGPASVEIADRALAILAQVRDNLRDI
jgi:methionine synthase II (cobalamin-independent)